MSDHRFLGEGNPDSAGHATKSGDITLPPTPCPGHLWPPIGRPRLRAFTDGRRRRADSARRAPALWRWGISSPAPGQPGSRWHGQCVRWPTRSLATATPAARRRTTRRCPGGSPDRERSPTAPATARSAAPILCGGGIERPGAGPLLPTWQTPIVTRGNGAGARRAGGQADGAAARTCVGGVHHARAFPVVSSSRTRAMWARFSDFVQYGADESAGRGRRSASCRR